MNKVYRQIWSKVKEKWIVVSEKVAKGGGPSRIVGALALAALLSLSGTVSALDPGALPTGGQITAGSGSIGASGSQMTVNQSTQQMIANWNTFNIGQNAGVRFNQPNSSATALNHIYDQNPSQILGSLSANGRVFLLNPSGIVFGQNARVDVGGLVASSLNMLDSDFLAGKYQFSNTGAAGIVINQGIINAMPGGIVALIAPKVINEGTITANSGSVILAAGNQVSLDFKGDGLISYTVNQGAIDALAANKGLIKADGGLVVMTAKAADSLTKAVVNQSGIIEAQTLQSKNGRIMLLSDMENGETIVSGKLDASAPNGGDGGFIETSANKVNIADSAKITTAAAQGLTGTWLIDPTDFTIASGSGALTTSGIGTTTLQTSLTDTNVTIATAAAGTEAGDINVNSAVTWSDNTLSLQAHSDININAVMTANDSAILDMKAGYSTPGTGGGVYNGLNTVKVGMLPNGGGFKGRVDFFEADGTTARSGDGFLTINGAGYTVITDLGVVGSTTKADLQGMNGDLTKNYALGSNIDASDTSTWNAGAGFTPIGTFDPDADPPDPTTSFSGTFDGLGHTVTGLTINRPADNQGLFGATSGAVLRNVGVVGGSITGGSNVGGLVGKNGYYDEDPEIYYGGSITNSYSTAAVTGTGDKVGGLVGYNVGGSITDSYATGAVTGVSNVGGLIGENDLDGITEGVGIITNSHYNIDTVLINGASHVTPYGLYGDQYIDWFDNGKALSITDYASLDPQGGDLYEIGNAQGLKDLLGFAEVSDYKFRLTANLDLADVKDELGSTSDWYIPVFSAGEFDGAGHTLKNLNVGNGVGAPINNNIGFVGILAPDSTLSNIGLTNVNVTGGIYVGSLVGYNYNGSITGSYAATGSVAGTGSVGGLVGQNDLESMITGSLGITNSHYNIDAVTINGASHVTPYGLYGVQYTDWFENSNTLNITDYASSLPLNGDYYEISDAQGLKDLLGFADTAGYKFRLIANLDLADVKDELGSTSDWYIPIFSAGEFDGNGHTLTNLNVNQPENGAIGFIGLLNTDSTLGNIGLTNVSVTGGSFVGGLVGLNAGIVENSYTTGTVTGSGDSSIGIGGLVGANAGSIDNSYASGMVEASTGVGGLVGFNAALDEGVVGTITNSYATGVVTGDIAVGGLVGFNQGGSITNSYATGAVTGSEYAIGGLVGVNQGGSIDNAYATGAVQGIFYVGGLAGMNSGSIDNAYATGAVTGGGAGSLVGANYGTADTVYATGTVNGVAGPLIGDGDDATNVVNPLTVFPNTWTGPASGGLWTTAGNWNAGHVPTIFETAVIGANSINIPGIVMAKDVTTTTGSALSFTGATVSSLAIGQNGTVTLGAAEDDVTLNYGTSGKLNLTGTGANPLYLSLNGTTYTVIQQLGEEDSGTGTDLQGINGGLTDNYVLGLDIDASSVSTWNANTGFTPIGTPSLFGGTDFSGIFDGLGHSVNNLIIDESSFAQGLFGGTSAAAVLRNVGLLNANIQGGTIVGGLVGWNSGSITNAYVTGKVSGDSAVGGLVGNNFGSITNAYATVTITGTSDETIVVGGLVGGNIGSIKTSHATGTVQGGNMVGGLVGLNDGNIENSYATGKVSGAFGVGGLVGAQNLDPSEGVIEAMNGSITNSYATGAVSGDYIVGGLVGLNDGSIIDSYATGDVTATVNCAGGLVGAQNIDPTGGEMIVFLNGSTTESYATGEVSGNNWIGGLIGVNAGTIDSSHATGNVTGTVDEDDEDTGNFIGGLVGVNLGSITGEVTDYSYATGAVSGRDYVGGLVGAQNLIPPDFLEIPLNGSIENAYAIGTVTGTGNNIGGLVGANAYYLDADTGISYGTITGSHATGAVTGTYLYDGVEEKYNGGTQVGGLVGANIGGSITNSYATGTVSGNFSIGGLVGLNQDNGSGGVGTITNTHATGAVSGIENVGGLVGTSGYYDPVHSDFHHDGGSITDSYATGTVEGEESTVGGLVGFNDGTIENTYATGPVSSPGSIGGLVGVNISSITNSYATGDVTATDFGFAGGLAGLNMLGSITNSYATGTVLGTNWIGGLVGLNNASINDSYATGDVTGDSFVGGLVGLQNMVLTIESLKGSIENSYATGTVNGTSSDVGGLVGLNQDDGSGAYGTITNAYATGAVIGVENIGGLVGTNKDDGSISNSYATGTVTGTNDGIGGLVGVNYGAITNAYASGKVTGDAVVGGLVGTNDGDGTITASFWDKDATGQLTSSGSLDSFGKTTAEMKTLATFTAAGWDIVGDATIFPGYPFFDTNGHIWRIGTKINYPEAPVQVQQPPPSITNLTGQSYLPPPSVFNTGETSDGVTVDLVSPPTQGEPGVIVVTIPNNLTGPDSYFQFALPESLTNAAAANPEAVRITLQDGSPLPSQLQYNPDFGMFEGTNVPEGYLPITVLFTVGDQAWTLEIKEKESKKK